MPGVTWFSATCTPGFDNAAALPRVWIDTTYSRPTGTTWVVTTDAEFSNALTNAQLNDVIQLQAGTTFAPITLPEKTSGSGWIYIQTSNYAGLPIPGTRLTGANSAPPSIVALATISVAGGATPGAAGSSNVAITTAPRAHHYRFVGIEVRTTTDTYVFNLCIIGGDAVLADLAHDIVFDRCYLHGGTTQGTRRGIMMNSKTFAIVDSYLKDFKEVGADTQGLAGWSGPGPFKIVNNYIEGAAENILFGGADAPNNVAFQPQDIEIRRNHCFKQPSWLAAGFSVKNLLELKNAVRVLIEGNRFEHCWDQGQFGQSLTLTVRNQDGGNTWAEVSDITYRYNSSWDIVTGIDSFVSDDLFQSQLSKRWSLHDNLFKIDRSGLSQRFWIFLGAGVGGGTLVDVTFDHNTCYTSITSVSSCSFEVTTSSTGTTQAAGVILRNNIICHGPYGWIRANLGVGEPSLNAGLDVSSRSFFQRNVLYNNGDNGAAYLPTYSDNFNTTPMSNWPIDEAHVQFTNAANNNFRLLGSSPYIGRATDGRDPGVDWPALMRKTSGCISGSW